ncbi:replicative DNA helicase [Pseudomonas aeruginosa]|uniref:replicative DNA helicase n=1 Tax=Pseudomonas aeruginosa TaxID=287 RepID=UPI000FC3FB36|nr:replicative DNA helicase [Pseudomonas aeruginosa]MCV4163008.1 replicative DNA helicase [Pseudomonas aeruginosa]RUD24731.1 replicative DNA helicase [Pseudomonas aeruginosa]HCE6855194.1 replicative DNA helicase [Pseudomonas aeruginosa]HCF4463309.1 replicative DNA helicase [Pseudomonas aeruginosa]
MRDPFSLEAEHGVLGAMLLRNELIDVLSSDLTPEDFYWPENGDLYRAILALHSDSQPADIVTVGEFLGDRYQVQTTDGVITGMAYIGQIIQNTPSVANAGTYSRIVRERAVDRALAAAGDRLHELALSEAAQADKVGAAQAMVMALDSKTSTHEVRHAADVLTDHIEELQRRSDLGGKLDGLSTGIGDLDQKLMGLKPGDMVVIAGRPAMGKTALAINIAEHVACDLGDPALVVSLEMTNGGLMDRILASLGRIPLTAIKDGSAPSSHGAELGSASLKVKRSKLYMADRPGLNAARLRALARRHKQRHGLSLLVVDYLQLLESSGKSTRTEDVSDMSRQCKLLAMELGIPVIVLSQLNRSLEQRPNKRPMMSDLRESGAIEQDADVIMFVYRDEVYHPDTQYRGVAELIIAKHRNGEPSTVRCAFLGKYSRFEQLAPGALDEFDFDEPQQAPKVTSMADRYRGMKGGRANG